jgi:hypothetical protein
VSSVSISEGSLLRSTIISLVIGIGSLCAAFVIRTLILIGTLDIFLELSIGIPLMIIFYIFAFIGESNYREMKRDVSGWWDIMALLAITFILALFLFSIITAFISVIIGVIFTYYIYRIQK